MRQRRLKAASHLPSAFYHCVSRVVDKQFIFGELEKEQFVRFMRLYETFCGVRVVTFCVMSNHFHILLEVPQRPEGFALSDEALLERLNPVNSPLEINTLRQTLTMLRSAGADSEAEAVKEKILLRMFDLSNYMKLLKGRFTQWYNRSHARKGTLWEDRFKSVLVEAAGEALLMMSAYIDLNPVRAGMVNDPKDYRWCGYGAAMGGSREALTGLKVIVDTREQMYGGKEIEGAEQILSKYRLWAYNQGAEGALGEDGNPVKRGFTEGEIEEVILRKGKLGRWELLRCRVRYFSDGAVLGSKAYVNAVFAQERHRFGAKRKTGAKSMRGVDVGELRTMRDLRVQPIG